MRDAIIISFVFHVAVIILTITGLPMISRDKPTIMKVIPIEMVKIGDVTKLNAQEKKPDPVKKKKTPPKRSAPERKVEMPPAPPKLASNMPLPDMKPKPKKIKKPHKKDPQTAAKRAPRITPKTKPRRFNAGKLAALLDKREKSEPDIVEKLKDKDYGKQKVISALDLQQQILSIGDAIDKHIYDNNCWNPPAGAKGAAGLLVTVRVRLGPDGKLIGSPKVLESGRMAQPGQEFFRAAAESALRAVRKCAPYDFLPKESYDLWRELDIVFDPEHMLNG